MDLSASPCSSSGCESGWTMYLEQSSLSKKQYQGFDNYVGVGYARAEGEKEEDLSMVSDASSGPPHYFVDDEDCFDKVTKKGKNRKDGKEHGRSLHPSFLDDTASSPAIDQRVTRNESSMNQITDMPHVFPEKQIKGKSALKKQFGFIQQESASKEQGGFRARKWK